MYQLDKLYLKDETFEKFQTLEPIDSYQEHPFMDIFLNSRNNTLKRRSPIKNLIPRSINESHERIVCSMTILGILLAFSESQYNPRTS